ILHFRVGDLCVNNTDLSPLSATAHCFVLLCIAQQYKAMCWHSKAHTQHTVKQHTVNPLIAPDFNPLAAPCH
ncbi:unnamed protein product, partial [Staurois parvus]